MKKYKDKKKRFGIIVPSLNTICEDDLRLFCPDDVAYHVHRIRLRKQDGIVTMDSLIEAYEESIHAASYIFDLSPDAITFNCTGASVSKGGNGDFLLQQLFNKTYGLPSSNTMHAIKNALKFVEAKKIVHICPFADKFSTEERNSLEYSGFQVLSSVGLNFVDAKKAAQMDPDDLAKFAIENSDPKMDAILLSCANVRAFEAVEYIEQKISVPVISSNQAVLWDVLKKINYDYSISNGGILFKN